MVSFLLFLGFVIPQILFVFALLLGFAAILKREEAARSEERVDAVPIPESALKKEEGRGVQPI